MRIQIFSDLHVDVRPMKPIKVAPDIDAVIIAGDVCEGAEAAFKALRLIVPMHIPVFFVLGNHEPYRRVWSEELAQARAVAPLYGVHLLENDMVTVAGIRIVGATLWTDYCLFGAPLAQSAMRRAADGLNDHRLITWTKKPWRRFRPQEALMLHRQSRAFIEAALAERFAGTSTVVITHHAPHPRSMHPCFEDDLLSAAFLSDLTATIESGQPALWIHGHVQNSCDYRIGATRIICNPHGYGAENPDFDPALVVDVA